MSSFITIVDGEHNLHARQVAPCFDAISIVRNATVLKYQDKTRLVLRQADLGPILDSDSVRHSFELSFVQFNLV